jgi:hypothetical protein
VIIYLQTRTQRDVCLKDCQLGLLILSLFDFCYVTVIGLGTESVETLPNLILVAEYVTKRAVSVPGVSFVEVGAAAWHSRLLLPI